MKMMRRRTDNTYIQQTQEVIGKKLTDLRIKRGYTTRLDFSEEHKLPPIQYWRVEKGKTNMTLKTLHKIVSIHGYTLEKFFRLVEKARKSA
jgi:hypothetical protein